MRNFPVQLKDTEALVLMWANEDEVEDSALEQLRNVSMLPGLHGLRVMPDVHWGNGATVGSVIAMENALAPAAVGVDIGCGVNAVRTSLTLEDLDHNDLKKLRELFEIAIPVGFHQYEEGGTQLAGLAYNIQGAGLRVLDRTVDLREDLTVTRKNGTVSAFDADIKDKAHKQLGTLGGGNHFIELCSDRTGQIWITLHSGSRNIGKTIAERHIEIAKSDPRNDDLPKHLKELSLFYTGTPAMNNYLADLNWAQEFAMVSRSVMMARVQREMLAYFEDSSLHLKFDMEINCHHNYVAIEQIEGKDMIVTRKGAISAKSGEYALIPGSMATGSYIVRGLGNPLSYQSASHGAGRRLSRTEAKRKYTVADVEETMEGIEARKDEGVIDEISLAYKNLDDVVAAQSDLVEVVEKLDTILCVKG